MARILVVDDDPLDLMILDSLLTAEGHELVFADDGSSALAFYTEQEFDLVVTDLVMPGIDGLRLIKEIMERNPGAAIIAISGMSPEQLPLARDYGAVQTLAKPIDRDALLATVEGVLGRTDPDETE